jgi:hypothetical protein
VNSVSGKQAKSGSLSCYNGPGGICEIWGVACGAMASHTMEGIEKLSSMAGFTLALFRTKQTKQNTRHV